MNKVFRCYKCDLPFARLQNGSIVIESRHHGEKHVNSISVWDLVLSVLKSVASIERGTPDRHSVPPECPACTEFAYFEE